LLSCRTFIQRTFAHLYYPYNHPTLGYSRKVGYLICVGLLRDFIFFKIQSALFLPSENVLFKLFFAFLFPKADAKISALSYTFQN